MKIIYVMGKSSSGKDTISEKIKEKLDINSYIPYTTRPKRDEEKEGNSYYFISNEKMEEKIRANNYNKRVNQDLIECRTYNTKYGLWTYATIYDEQFKQNKDMIMVGTLESYKKIMRFLENRKNEKDKDNTVLLPIYVEVENGLRLKRAIAREEQQKNPRYDELCRRFLSDEIDFSEKNLKECNIKERFENVDLDSTVNEILQYITKYKDINQKDTMEH